MKNSHEGSQKPATLLHIATVPMSLTFLRGQAEFMRSHGLRMHALSSPGADLETFGDRESVEVHGVRMTREITPVADLRALVGIRRVLGILKPEIVHAHTPKAGLLGMMAASAGGPSVRIYQMRGLPLLTSSGAKRWTLRQAERVSCGLADLVICNSHSLRRTAIAEGLCHPEKIKVLGGGSGNGVEARRKFSPDALPPDARSRTRERFGIPSEAIVLGFVGRIAREKGVIELVEAWRRFREENTQAHLLIVGPYEERDPISTSTRAILEGDPRVHLAGMDWDTPPLYAAMDLIVLPTYREGFPNVLLEAAAMRLPVIATRVEGCVDAVQDGVTGILIPPRNSAALYEAIHTYGKKPEMRAAHGSAGRTRALHDFRPEKIWELYLHEYSRLCAEKRFPVPKTMYQAA